MSQMLEKLFFVIAVSVSIINSQQISYDRSNLSSFNKNSEDIRNNFTTKQNSDQIPGNNRIIKVKKIWFNLFSFEGQMIKFKDFSKPNITNQAIEENKEYREQANSYSCFNGVKSSPNISIKFTGSCLFPIIVVSSESYPEITDHINQIHVKADYFSIPNVEKLKTKEQTIFEYKNIREGKYNLNNQILSNQDKQLVNRYICIICLAYDPGKQKYFSYIAEPIKSLVSSVEQISVTEIKVTDRFFNDKQRYTIGNLGTLKLAYENPNAIVTISITTLSKILSEFTIIEDSGEKTTKSIDYTKNPIERIAGITSKKFTVEIHNSDPSESLDVDIEIFAEQYDILSADLENHHTIIILVVVSMISVVLLIIVYKIISKSKETRNRAQILQTRNRNSSIHQDPETEPIKVFNLNDMPTSIKSDSPVQKINKEKLKIYEINISAMEDIDVKDSSMEKELRKKKK